MNYYERHIGDFIKDTLGLTMLEDGAYNRLLDQVYQTERPLPADKKEIYRNARATSAAERKAVDYVLAKFFDLGPDGYMQKRAQAILEEYWDREPAEQNKRENTRDRQRRSRERRKQLFEQLRELGVTPPFNASMKVLEAELSRVTSGDSNASNNAPVTRDDTATQKPEANSQVVGDGDGVTEPRPAGGSRLGDLCILLRRAGVNLGPDAFGKVDWHANPKVTDDVVRKALDTAKKRAPRQITPAYLAPIIADLLSEADAVEASKLVAGRDYV